jgi:hypothetical protein
MSGEDDLALLRRFEPIIRYTRGELFFPMNVETYLRGCSLWVQRPNEEPVCLVPQGELTVERLTEPRQGGFGAIYYLKFIDPLNLAELAAYRLRQGLRRRNEMQLFHAGRGRLARVGYGSRLIDALFSLTLLARGRVPGDTAAAAALEYQRLMKQDEEYCYYGRVVRVNGWVALQYWFFYPFNNWRSGFFGVNDHEADWEMIYVYLYEASDGHLAPEWVAYASHDYEGDDLRRRWDDPELSRVGEHPVIFAGAGSHASYYHPGEYLAELELPFLAPLVRLVDRLQILGRRLLHYVQESYDPEGDQGPDFNVFRVPFVEYARGDGIVLGPSQEREWTGRYLIEPPPLWASGYRGLWGLYARDTIAGENAPAGPLYDRDGTTRRSWYDPLGWAGLDKLPAPDEALAVAQEQIVEIESRSEESRRRIDSESRVLAGLGVQARALQAQPHLRQQFARQQEQIQTLSDELNQRRADLAADDAVLAALRLYVERLQAGQRGSARSHLRRAHRPFSDSGLRFGRFAEAWAAISIGLLLISLVALFLFAREFLVFGLAALVALLIFVEAGFRRRLSLLVTSITVSLAIMATLVLLYEFFWETVLLAVLTAGSYIMWENLRELWT